jgi:hypothetical protein
MKWLWYAVAAANQQPATRPKILVVAILPILIFGLLDAYYLGLERRFRDCYDTFVKKLHNGTARVDDTFIVTPRLHPRGLFPEMWSAMFSFSIWPVYGGLLLLIWLLKIRLWGG